MQVFLEMCYNKKVTVQMTLVLKVSIADKNEKNIKGHERYLK